MNWNAVRLVAKKEWKESFNSPMPYIFLVVFYLVMGWFFVSTLFLLGQASIEEFLSPLPLLLVFFLPAFTMRLFSEEYKTGTIELLATLPLRDTEIVLGKFAAALAMWVLMLVLSGSYVLLIFVAGTPDLGQVAAGFLGALFLGVLYCSAGVFASTLTRSQVVGFLFGFLLCFVFFLFGKVSDLVPGFAGGLLSFLGVDSHYAAFLRGVIDTRDVVYFVSGTVFFLTAALASFYRRRW